FPGSTTGDDESKIIKGDIDGATMLAGALEERMKSLCAGGRTACVPVNPPVIAATLGGSPILGALGAVTPLGVRTFTQRSAASHDDLEGLRLGDGLRPGSGDLRSRVSQLQDALNAAGATLGTDGKFGPATGAALTDFQAQRGLPARPFVDQITATLLADPSPIQIVITSSTFQGLRQNDGITWGTWELRPRVTALQERLTVLGSPCKADGMFGK